MNTDIDDAEALTDFLRDHPKLVVLTGAGASIESGIPAYRDDAGKWLPGAPIEERDFLNSAHTRKRYWSRSWYGWPRIRDARPNACHTALARLEQRGRIKLLITQNVDGLHQKAGSRNVVDLHGRVDRVLCMQCATHHPREEIQKMLASCNDWPRLNAAQAMPDGDAAVPDRLLAEITLPRCRSCDGQLRPDVVFFGGSVPAERVTRCQDALAQADALLVVGSSLMVFSGFRFCRSASRLKMPIAILNRGATRADDMAQVRLSSPAGPLLASAVVRLGQDSEFSGSG